MTILAIARITILEAARRRLLVAQAALSLLVVALTGLGFHLIAGADDHGQQISPVIAQLVASQLLILIMFGFSAVLALGGALSAAPAIASDVESGVVLAILARPVSRATLVVGRWLGVATMVAAYAAGVSAMEVLVCWLATGYSPPDPITLAVALAVEGVVIVSLSLLLSTRLPAVASGITTLILFFGAWMGGIAEAVGTYLRNSTVSGLGQASRLLIPSDGIWRGALYAMEPPEILGIAQAVGPAAGANPFLATAPVSIAYLVWVAAWLLAVLALAALSFGRRDV
jgi:ABC-type transport system involved in multi-copper enzyme maturation permease subunit